MYILLNGMQLSFIRNYEYNGRRDFVEMPIVYISVPIILILLKHVGLYQ